KSKRPELSQADHFFILGNRTSGSSGVLGPLATEASYAAGCSATFLAICFFKSRARCDSSPASAFRRNASRPPRCSTERSAVAEMRRRTLRFSASEISVTLTRFGRKRRLVLLLAWLTLWPLCTALPVSSHSRDMIQLPRFDRRQR